MTILSRQNIPNLLTGLRFIMLAPVAAFLLDHQFNLAFGFFTFAAISDWLDGWLARRYAWTSRFGSIADPLADKLLMMICYSCLAWVKAIPIWLFAVVIFRDVWLLSGIGLFRFFIGNIEFKPTQISKINTALQLIFVGGVLLNLTFLPIYPRLLQILMYLVLITTVITFVDYTREGIQRTHMALKERSRHAQ